MPSGGCVRTGPETRGSMPPGTHAAHQCRGEGGRPGRSRTVTQSAGETAKHETLYGVKILAIRTRDSASSQLDQRLGLEQPAVTQWPVVQVAVSSLSVRDSVRMAGEDQEHIEALTAVQGQLPPIIVHRRTMRVIDGVHRLRAAKLQAQDHIAVRFFDGDETDAHVLAVSSNIAHGLPLSLADRKAAAARIIVSHPQWSDRMIASVAGLAARTVAEIRKRPAIEPARCSSRIGQDGRVRPIDGGRGRERAFELMTRDPSLSLRQVARAAGISPETVRDVRGRLRRAEEPVPKQRGKGQLNHGGRPARPRSEPPSSTEFDQAQRRNPATVRERLKADPSLRFTETGRILLRLLYAHAINTEEWEKIIQNIPPHCSGLVAQLASDNARMWQELAERLRGPETSVEFFDLSGDPPAIAGPAV
jgi:ParB-like chromosome segregation protein Spo0J